MVGLKTFYHLLIGRVDIPENINKNNDVTILHISDTPSTIYKELKRIIKLTNPTYIIHTGDLVDDVKIGMFSSLKKRYMHEVKKLLKILNDSNAKKIFVTIGNHDDYEFVKLNSKRIKVIETKDILDIEGVKFAVSHYFNSLGNLNADYYLFGHDLTKHTEQNGPKEYLNGISSINYIFVKSKFVKRFPYPAGTDADRLLKRKLKL